MTFEEIIEKLKELANSNKEYKRRNDISHLYFFAGTSYPMPNPLPNDIGTWKEVDKYGGEGKGEKWFTVKHFIEHDVYIRLDGYYTSYNGIHFDSNDKLIEVKPIIKTIISFE